MESKTAFNVPGKYETLCATAQELLASKQFQQVLAIFNRHTAGTRMKGEPATSENVLADRNLRYRLHAFYRDRLECKLTGVDNMRVLDEISKIVECAMDVLDERNQKLRSGKMEIGDHEDELLLNRRFDLTSAA